MKIFLVDNFDSFTFNLVDYFKQLGCDVHVYRNTINIEKVEEVDPDLIVFSPGPSVPKNAGNMMALIDRYHKKYPMFGVCLGQEAFIEYFGGSLKFVTPVHGKASLISHDGKSIFENLDRQFLGGRYHSLCADVVPKCFDITATCGDLVMAIRHKTLPIESVQFHPESVLTMKRGQGFKIIENVVKKFAGDKVSNEIEEFLNDCVSGKLSVEEQVKFLERYTPDKVTADDIKIFADFMIKNMAAKLDMPDAIDICGTGGSGLNRINTSTIAAFILAELGVKVAKHGNKAASGRFGSFDLLEALGVDIKKAPEELCALYKRHGLAFIFARNFHPVMKHFVEARKLIGKPTIFNILGPLLNPADAKVQIIGTSFKDQMKLIAEACKLLGKKRVMIVRGRDSLDEVTLTGETDVVELNDGKITQYVIKPEDFGIKRTKFKEIAGGDAKFNTNIALQILKGECKSRHADLVFMNVALALKLAGKVADLKHGYKMAKEVFGIPKLESYKGNILREIAATKLLRKSDRDFKAALKGKGVSVIAEIKKASPSEGELLPQDRSIEEIAKMYEEGGASAISVVTDEQYFGGSFDNLRKVMEATKLPLLCKDFVVNEFQIYKAREYGADAVLLICALLQKEKLRKFIKLAADLGMDALVEVHNEDEVKQAITAGAKIIGINNRDLSNFSIDLNLTNQLVKKIPRNIVTVSESGINSREDIKKLNKRVDAVLVGTALMRAVDIKEKLYEIT